MCPERAVDRTGNCRSKAVEKLLSVQSFDVLFKF